MLLHAFTTAALCATAFASSLVPRQGRPGDHLVRVVYQFPNNTWVENLAVRSNGNILVTLITAPEVWEVSPFADPPTAELIYTFTDALSVLGITEYAPDAFAVIVGNFTDAPVPGSYSVWSVDFGKRGHYRGHGRKGPRVHKITDVPEANFLNGATTLPAVANTVLLADSGVGQVYRLNALMGDYSVAIDVPAMHPNASGPLPLGVNGIHFAPGEDDYLYFTNTFKRPNFSRVPVDAQGSATGPSEPIIKSVAKFEGSADDFAIDTAGNAWIADGAFNGLLKVDIADKSAEIVLGGTDRSKVVGETAAQFGRASSDVKKGTLYITNNGGLAVPPPSGIVGGGVWALDTAKL